jgi:hypothetical protein
MPLGFMTVILASCADADFANRLVRRKILRAKKAARFFMLFLLFVGYRSSCEII